jgi:hypothetical protein
MRCLSDSLSGFDAFQNLDLSEEHGRHQFFTPSFLLLSVLNSTYSLVVWHALQNFMSNFRQKLFSF